MLYTLQKYKHQTSKIELNDVKLSLFIMAFAKT